ncbi:protein of unknown function [Bradyrhizobium sp. ORS 285]|nr:protein of unknown function [Bradyrhizobium sp. ORS 285]
MKLLPRPKVWTIEAPHTLQHTFTPHPEERATLARVSKGEARPGPHGSRRAAI